MRGIPKVQRNGIVTKVLRPAVPMEEETVEIQLEGADPLYSEIRIPNSFEDASGNKWKVKLGTRVSVTIEMDSDQVSSLSGERARAAAQS